MFTPHDNVKLAEGWTIKTGGVPLHGSVPNYNSFVFCFSEVRNVKEIDEASGGKATDYYYISDIQKFGLAITSALEREFIKLLNAMNSPESNLVLEQGYEVIPTLYRVNYSDTPKSKEVNERNIDSIDPWSIDSRDLWHKPTSYKYEREIRFVWTFARKDKSGLKPYAFPQPDCDYVDLTLGRGALPITGRQVKNTYPIKDA